MEINQQQELIGIIDKFSNGDGIHATDIAGVKCLRLSEEGVRLPDVYSPSLCIIVQGQKRVMLLDQTFEYQPPQYLAVSVELPVIGVVTQGSPELPYLCLQIELDPHVLAELLIPSGFTAGRRMSPRRGIFVARTDAALGDGVLRLARLLNTPRDIPLLAPLIKREIFYRILSGGHGEAVAQMVSSGSHMQRIAAAIQQIKLSYDKPVKVESLARQVGMSVSSFHAHFKTVTAMSPLQYQKRLRLLEARQIMLVEQQDAASTSYRVGYQSPAQFSREYSRTFGNPPGRDIDRMLAVRNDWPENV